MSLYFFLLVTFGMTLRVLVGGDTLMPSDAAVREVKGRESIERAERATERMDTASVSRREYLVGEAVDDSVVDEQDDCDIFEFESAGLSRSGISGIEGSSEE